MMKRDNRTESDSPVGYIAVKKSNGFGGPLKVAVSVDPTGTVVNAIVLEHRETFSWFDKVMKSPLIESMRGKRYTDPLEIGHDVDGITGATYTSRAVIQSVKAAARGIALNQLHLPIPDEKPVPIQNGISGICPGFIMGNRLLWNQIPIR